MHVPGNSESPPKLVKNPFFVCCLLFREIQLYHSEVRLFGH